MQSGQTVPGKQVHMVKSVHYIKIDRVLLESLVIVVNKIPFFNVIIQTCIQCAKRFYFLLKLHFLLIILTY